MFYFIINILEKKIIFYFQNLGSSILYLKNIFYKIQVLNLWVYWYILKEIKMV